ncbi:Aste57867_24788 [Aphanomyces stellatus]|uniref:Aste57867_24788 protein n=1 Tax=Aphanomyces stellatus TaxID=120398 RepID=A0A485LRG4_9STRA|nr:hypothetical protein As57867_024710 [Aphanomyces stellatus]VFU01423.1 Aste57867_24788 [Aphanomyces stellatus]
MSKRLRCVERNKFLRRELATSQLNLENAMRQWDAELTRTCFFAWYEGCIIRKKVIAKKLKWFSVWYSGSPRAVMLSTFEEWKCWTSYHVNQRITQQLHEDCEKVATAQKNVADLTETNDSFQEEFIWLQEDHNTLFDNVQLLHVHIEHAKLFLSSTSGREEEVCYDGQLRMEVVSEIAHFILESLLRFQYNLGFHQTLLGHFSPDEYCLEQFVSFVLKKTPAARPTVEQLSVEEFMDFLVDLDEYMKHSQIRFSDTKPPEIATPQTAVAYIQEFLIECIRQQDHYAVSPTLCFARHFEDHEISVMPLSNTRHIEQLRMQYPNDAHQHCRQMDFCSFNP